MMNLFVVFVIIITGKTLVLNRYQQRISGEKLNVNTFKRLIFKDFQINVNF